MKVKCDYCRADIEDTDEKCPHCGADNSHLKRVGAGVPQTIEELKKWYIDHNLPDENVTRFFIGKNYTAPKAFGIYKEENTGNIIVYKNKADGTRSIRYEGKDEVYAVNELYIKLKEEIIKKVERFIKEYYPGDTLMHNYLGKKNYDLKNGKHLSVRQAVHSSCKPYNHEGYGICRISAYQRLRMQKRLLRRLCNYLQSKGRSRAQDLSRMSDPGSGKYVHRYPAFLPPRKADLRYKQYPYHTGCYDAALS